MSDTESTAGGDSTHEPDDVKRTRLEHPSGWLLLTRHESVQLMLDALLSYPPYREFNKTELAEQAGVSRQSVGNHLDLLLRLEILEPVNGTTPQRYRFNEESAVSQGIIDLNGRINAVGEADESVGNE